MKIVETRFRKLRSNITEEELERSLAEFKEFFSKESFYGLKKEPLLFDVITVNLLQQLQVVATANGGSLTRDEFVKALVNLQKPLDQK